QVLHLAETLVKAEGNRDGIEQRGRRLVPELKEGAELVGERGTGAEDGLALLALQLDVRGSVERGDDERDAATEDGAGRLAMALDVPLRLGGGLAVVTDADCSAHHDDALDPWLAVGVFGEQFGDVGERPDGAERQLARVRLELRIEELDGAFLDGPLAEGGAQAVLHLSAEVRRVARRRARGDGDVSAADGVQQAAEDEGARVRVAVNGGDAVQADLGTRQDERQGEGIVDVAADVGVEQDGHLRHSGGISPERARQQRDRQSEDHDGKRRTTACHFCLDCRFFMMSCNFPAWVRRLILVCPSGASQVAVVDGSSLSAHAVLSRIPGEDTVNKPIILCGLGRIGWRVLEYLQAANLPVVAVDNICAPDDPRLGNARLVHGDCRRREVLEQAGIRDCGGVLIMISNDLTNITTALMVRSLNTDVRIVLRVFNENLIGRLGHAIHHIYPLSTSALVAPLLAVKALTGQALGTFRVERPGNDEGADPERFQVAELTI